MQYIHLFPTSGSLDADQNDQNESPEIVLHKTAEGHASWKRSNTGFDESILGESMHPDVCDRNGAQGNKGKRNAHFTLGQPHSANFFVLTGPGNLSVYAGVQQQQWKVRLPEFYMLQGI